MNLNRQLDLSLNLVREDFNSYRLEADGSVVKKNWLNSCIRWIEDWWSHKTIRDSVELFRKALIGFQALSNARKYHIGEVTSQEVDIQIKRLAFIRRFILLETPLFLHARTLDCHVENLLNQIENRPPLEQTLSPMEVLERIRQTSFKDWSILSIQDLIVKEDQETPDLSQAVLEKRAPDLSLKMPEETLKKRKLLDRYDTIFNFRPSIALFSWIKARLAPKYLSLEEIHRNQLEHVCETILKKDPKKLGINQENKEALYEELSRRLEQISELLEEATIALDPKKNALIILCTETEDLCIPKWKDLFETVVRDLLNKPLDAPFAIFLTEKSRFVKQVIAELSQENPQSQHIWNALRTSHSAEIGQEPLEPSADIYARAYAPSRLEVNHFIDEIKEKWKKGTFLNNLLEAINQRPFNPKIRTLLIENLSQRGLPNAEEFVDTHYYRDEWRDRFLTSAGASRLIRACS